METCSREFTFDELKLRRVIATTNNFLNKSKHLYYMPFFFMKYLWTSNMSSTAVAS